MARLPGRDATRRLTRIGLVLSHRPARGDWLGRGAMALAGLLVGAAAASQYREIAAPPPPQPPVDAAQPQPLQQRLDQSLLTLLLSEARGLPTFAILPPRLNNQHESVSRMLKTIWECVRLRVAFLLVACDDPEGRKRPGAKRLASERTPKVERGEAPDRAVK